MRRETPDLVVFGGDVTWGPLPRETLALVAERCSGRTSSSGALGPDVELRRTEYPVERAVEAYRATDDPLADEMVEILLTPPTRGEVIEHSERLEFSG